METTADVPVPNRSKLRSVAKFQRYVILALLGNITIAIISFLIMIQAISPSEIGVTVFRLAALAITIFMIYSVVMLARQFSNIAIAILSGLAMFLPLISLIVLLVFSQKATAFLRANGVDVGFFGVNPESV